MKQVEKVNKQHEVKLQRKTDQCLNLLKDIEAMKSEADNKHREIEKLKRDIASQKEEEEKLIAKMKVLSEEAGNAA